MPRHVDGLRVVGDHALHELDVRHRIGGAFGDHDVVHPRHRVLLRLQPRRLGEQRRKNGERNNKDGTANNVHVMRGYGAVGPCKDITLIRYSTAGRCA